MKDVAITYFGDNNRGFTALTPRGQEWLIAHDVRHLANRIWINTLIVGPQKAIPLLKILESQSDVAVLFEIPE